MIGVLVLFGFIRQSLARFVALVGFVWNDYLVVFGVLILFLISWFGLLFCCVCGFDLCVWCFGFGFVCFWWFLISLLFFGWVY